MSFADFGQPVTLSPRREHRERNWLGICRHLDRQHARKRDLSAAEVTTRLTALPELTKSRAARG